MHLLQKFNCWIKWIHSVKNERFRDGETQCVQVRITRFEYRASTNEKEFARTPIWWLKIFLVNKECQIKWYWKSLFRDTIIYYPQSSPQWEKICVTWSNIPSCVTCFLGKTDVFTIIIRDNKKKSVIYLYRCKKIWSRCFFIIMIRIWNVL